MLNNESLFIDQLPKRLTHSHKGMFGCLSIIGGSVGTAGAVILASRAALYFGAGRIYATLLEKNISYDFCHPEIMFRHIDALNFCEMDAIVIGPGLGQNEEASNILSHVLETKKAKIIDADALNLLAKFPALKKKLRDREINALKANDVLNDVAFNVLTPHPGEAARLLNTDIESIQKNRIDAARELASQCNAIIVLKGAGTIITSPQGKIVINQTGNAALATAGTGDVLSGMIGALIAQKMPLFEAALAAVFLHGRAAEILTDQYKGPIGLAASEVAPTARLLINQLYQSKID